MSNDEFHQKSVAVLTDVSSIYEHSSGLVYAKDSESISFHTFWIKWYLKRLNESLAALEDVGF